MQKETSNGCSTSKSPTKPLRSKETSNGCSTSKSPSKPPRPKEYAELPVYVVEYHHEALPFIYQSVGSKYLPIEGNTIIHLDSHPDLGIPLDMPANQCFNKHELFSHLSIENWILPGAYAGIIKNVVWIKPVWSKQITEGYHNIIIGEDKATKEIKVSSALQYFIGEAVYTQEKNLDNIKKLNLEVVTLSHDDDKVDDIPSVQAAIQKYVKGNEKFILDIDLDFFSTKNPFLEMYSKADMYNHLRKLYAFNHCGCKVSDDVDSLTKITEHRLKQLSELKSVFQYLEENLFLDEAPEEITSLPCYPGVEELYKKLQDAYPDNEIEWMIVHDAGCTIDETELPHHVTERSDLEYYLNDVFPKFLDTLPGQPTIVTISRSATDEYCPQEDVNFIQEAVLSHLKTKFETINVTLDYCDDDDDIPVLVPSTDL